MNIVKWALRNKVLLALIVIIVVGVHLRVSSFNWPYLRNIDSYMFYRYMDYVVQSGNVPPRDMLMTAPVGWPMPHPFNFYIYLGAYSYMAVKLFFNIELWQWLIWFPAILASLVAIPSYYLGKVLYDRKAGLFTAFFMVFATANVSRSLGGDPDSDAIVILMPMAAIAAYLIAYKALNKKLWPLLSIVTGVMLAIFAYSWPGYWYIYWIITGFIISWIATGLITSKISKKTFDLKKYKNLVLSFAIINVAFFLLMIPAYGINFVSDTLTAPISTAGLFSEGGGLKSEAAEMPNVYVSVQELISGGGLKDIIERTGNIGTGDVRVIISPFALTICCFVYLAYAYYRRREHLDTLLLLAIWFIGALLSSMSAVRFTTMLVPVFCIASGIIFSKLWKIALGIKK